MRAFALMARDLELRMRGLGPPEATTARHRGFKNPRPSIVEDFQPPEATTVGHRGSRNPRPSTFEDFDPLEATTVGHRCSRNPRPSVFENLELPEATTVRHRGLRIQDLHLLRISKSQIYEKSSALDSTAAPDMRRVQSKSDF